MSYLYTPSSTWAASVTIPADSDAGRASGELATTLKTLANRNAWLAGQVTVDSYLVKSASIGSVTSTESVTNFYHDVSSITIDTTGCIGFVVVAAPTSRRSSFTEIIPIVLVLNGTHTGVTSHRVDASIPYPSGAISVSLFGASTVQSANVVCTVYSFTSTIPGSPRAGASLSSARFDVYRVRS